MRTGAYKKETKALPIGVSDYVRAQSEYYYVDKTLLIKEFLDQKPVVSLFTRPRRLLEQIETKKYDIEMKSDGIVQIMKLGIAFSGKRIILLYT